jgi:hypothetical protein
MMKITRMMAAFALGLLAACGGGGSSGPTLGTKTDKPGLPVFQQVVPHGGPGGESSYEAITNYWDLSSDLSISDGSDDQFDDALVLAVGTLGTSPATHASVLTEFEGLTPFGDLDAADVQFYTPLADRSAGLIPAIASTENPISGTASAWLQPMAKSRLSQVVDLTGATGVVQLSLRRRFDVSANWAGVTPRWRIALLDPASGAVILTAEESTASNTSGVFTFDISAAAGRRVALAFDLFAGYAEAGVDDVSIKDQGGAGSERVANGDFETGDLTGWTASTYDSMPTGISHNTPQTMAGLEVTRAFFVRPTSYWGRWVDTFHNPGDTDVTTDIVYYNELGSDGQGIIYDTPGVTGAVTSWDGNASDRDVALVSGAGTKAASIFYVSDTALGADAGSDVIFFVHHVTVPAGGTISLVNFIVMTGVDTGSLDTTVDITARATLADEQAAAIVNDFWKKDGYREGMTRAQLDSVVNF